MYFKTFDEALYLLSIPDTLKCLKIVHDKGSYESFTQNGRILYCVGQGRKKSPGHPSGHQAMSKQILLNGNQRLYPAFRILSNCVEYMGNYRLVSYKKAISFEGFLYFEYKLFRENMYSVINTALEVMPKYLVDVDVDVDVDVPKVPELEVKLAPIVSTGFCWFPSCRY